MDGRNVRRVPRIGAARCRHRLVACGLVLALGVAGRAGQQLPDSGRHAFDQTYGHYADLLRDHVVETHVDYRRLLRSRVLLASIVDDFARVSAQELSTWTAEHQLAYWINAYNVFTLQAVSDHYPIKNRWFTLFGFVPPNSIKQIPGVWNDLRWRAGGGERTLDEIEHDIIRVRYDEPRIHFAVNCAAISCPPLHPDPYVGTRLDEQLARAARDFLNSQHGLQVDGSTLLVSRVFSWYGDDFIEDYAGRVESDRSASERAILGVVAAYGTPSAARLARSATADVGFLDYDWGLNDVGAR